MLVRIKALTEVGRYLGIEAMLAQIKEEEARDLYEYTRRYYVNMHGMSQTATEKAWGWRQEAAELGQEYVKPIYLHCRELVVTGQV